MKELQKMNFARLLNLEAGQHVKSIQTNLAKVTLSDTILTAYLDNLTVTSTAFDRAMVQIRKSDETAKIVAADTVRDYAYAALSRALHVHEFSLMPEKKAAYLSLDTLFETYRDLPKWNLERESNGISNLITDLGSDKYSAHASLLGLNTFINDLETAEAAFKLLFDGRTTETTEKEIFDVKLLRDNMKHAYNDMTEYVLAMSKAKPTDVQYSKSLDYINTVRKYYADMLARRKGEEAIAPLSA